MSKRFISMLALGLAACATQAMAHELAYSKSENVRVSVPGEANTWCKDSVALTFERDSWTDSGPLDRLLPKIPFILGKDCPKAKVTWTATDKSGVVYAEGNGTADNLGLINLKQAVAQKAPEPAAQPSPAQVPTPSVAQAPAPVESAAPASTKTEPAPAVAAQPAAPEPTAAPAQAAPVLAASDLGRNYLLSTGYFTEIKDQNGCAWLGDNQQLDGQADMYSVKSTGGSCSDGKALGEFKRADLRHADGSTRSNDSNFMVLPSGLVFSTRLGDTVKHLPVTYINDRKNNVLMEVGTVPGKDIKVYLALTRYSNDNMFGEFSNSPNFVAITQDESFAFDDRQMLDTLRAIHDTVRANYKGRLDGVYVYVAKDIPSLYPKRNTPTSYENWIVQTSLTERDGEMVTDLRRVENYAVRRKQQMDRVAQQQLEKQYRIHSQLMERYNAAREKISAGESEVEYVAGMQSILTYIPSYNIMMNPKINQSPSKMLLKVGDREGDYYEVTEPSQARLYSERDLEPGWHIIPVISRSFVTPYEKGRAVKAFQGYATTSEACAQDKCADVLSLARAVAMDVGRWNPDVDLTNWTPEASQQVIDAYNAMKQQNAN